MKINKLRQSCDTAIFIQSVVMKRIMTALECKVNSFATQLVLKCSSNNFMSQASSCEQNMYYNECKHVNSKVIQHQINKAHNAPVRLNQSLINS